MKKLILILMVGSLFADIGVGFHIQSTPKISIPIRFKKMIVEPSLEFSSVTIMKNTLQESIYAIGLYRLFPINNNINMLGGISCGFLTKNTDYNLTVANTVTSLNLGFSYQLNDNCHLGYELVNQKIFFAAFKNERFKQLSSKFIIRLYK